MTPAGMTGGHFGVPTLSERAEGHTVAHRYREMGTDPARSETPGMHGRTSHGGGGRSRAVCAGREGRLVLFRIRTVW
jgi:hypothetical protein